MQAEGSTVPTRKDCGLLPRRGLDSGVPPGSCVTPGCDSGLSLPMCTPGLTTPTSPAVRICRPGGQLGCCPALTDGAVGPPPAWGRSAPVPLGCERPTPVSPAAVGAAVGRRHLTRQGLVCNEGTAQFTLSQASLRVHELTCVKLFYLHHNSMSKMPLLFPFYRRDH